MSKYVYLGLFKLNNEGEENMLKFPKVHGKRAREPGRSINAIPWGDTVHVVAASGLHSSHELFNPQLFVGNFIDSELTKGQILEIGDDKIIRVPLVKEAFEDTNAITNAVDNVKGILDNRLQEILDNRKKSSGGGKRKSKKKRRKTKNKKTKNKKKSKKRKSRRRR